MDEHVKILTARHPAAYNFDCIFTDGEPFGILVGILATGK